MFKKLKKKHDEISLNNLNIITLLLAFIIFLIAIYCTKNIFILIIIYLLIYELYYHTKNKSIQFLTDISGILLLGYFFINLLNISIFDIDFKKYLLIIVKLSFVLDYLFIFIKEIKKKKIEVKRIKHGKKYTFKELRSKKEREFRNKEEIRINNYLKEENIPLGSDYEKVIKDNLANLTNNKLDKYIWTNYLRFYKNQKNHIVRKIDKFNFLFLLIHVIILILSFVR